MSMLRIRKYIREHASRTWRRWFSSSLSQARLDGKDLSGKAVETAQSPTHNRSENVSENSIEETGVLGAPREDRKDKARRGVDSKVEKVDLTVPDAGGSLILDGKEKEKEEGDAQSQSELVHLRRIVQEEKNRAIAVKEENKLLQRVAVEQREYHSLRSRLGQLESIAGENSRLLSVMDGMMEIDAKIGEVSGVLEHGGFISSMIGHRLCGIQAVDILITRTRRPHDGEMLLTHGDLLSLVRDVEKASLSAHFMQYGSSLFHYALGMIAQSVTPQSMMGASMKRKCQTLSLVQKHVQHCEWVEALRTVETLDPLSRSIASRFIRQLKYRAIGNAMLGVLVGERALLWQRMDGEFQQ